MMSDTIIQDTPCPLQGLWVSLLSGVPAAHSFRLNRSFHVKTHRSWRIERRRNGDHHLLYVIDGRGTYWLDRTPVPLERGRLIFIGEGYPHASEASDDPPRIMPLRFSLTENAGGLEIHEVVPPFAVALISSDPERDEAMFRRVCDADRHNVPGLASSALHLILADLARATTSPLRESDPRIDKVKTHIDELPEKRDAVPTLADRAGLSAPHFSRLFRMQTGMTPAQYQIRSRIRTARHLLEETLLPIKAIAAELGYPDPYSFSKQFRHVTGTSPTRFRNGRE